jgi:hypothetical protein
MIRPKSQNYKIGHDGILSIGIFILMIKNHILLFQLPGNWPTTKKCAPYFRGNMEFPIYSEFHTLTDLYTKFQLSWYYGSQKLGHRLADTTVQIEGKFTLREL